MRITLGVAVQGRKRIYTVSMCRQKIVIFSQNSNFRTDERRRYNPQVQRRGKDGEHGQDGEHNNTGNRQWVPGLYDGWNKLNGGYLHCGINVSRRASCPPNDYPPIGEEPRQPSRVLE